MWLIPASLRDACLLFEWARDKHGWLDVALPNSAHWGSNEHRLKISLSKHKRRVLLASEQGQSTFRRRMVGLIVIDEGSTVRWAVCPQYDREAVATKMLKLIVEPHFSTMVDRDDDEAQRVLKAAGFDLLEDGDRQLWRADRALPWVS